MDGGKINAFLAPDSLFAGKVTVLDAVDSTNTRLKVLAETGAPEGTVLLAEEQTAGRGTGRREFFSPRGEGLYLSVLLRPHVGLSDLLTLTGWVAVAVCRGIEKSCGAPCRIKWLNDIYLNGRKLCGILTELPALRGDGADYVVVGVGINLSQTAQTFAAQGLEHIATSLETEGYSVSREELAAGILTELEALWTLFPRGKQDYLADYRRRCLTVGRPVTLTVEGEPKTGIAVDVDDEFALVVEIEGQRRTVFSVGEEVRV